MPAYQCACRPACRPAFLPLVWEARFGRKPLRTSCWFPILPNVASVHWPSRRDTGRTITLPNESFVFLIIQLTARVVVRCSESRVQVFRPERGGRIRKRRTAFDSVSDCNKLRTKKFTVGASRRGEVCCTRYEKPSNAENGESSLVESSGRLILLQSRRTSV